MTYRICIVTPAPVGSTSGNRVTAERWQSILTECGHRCVIQETLSADNADWDLLIALHARRSAKSVELFHDGFPDRPIITALTGTDLYQDLSTSRPAQQALERSTRLVVLQADAPHYLPQDQQHKAAIIFQSVTPFIRRIQRRTDCLQIAVVGHLRDVKRPLDTAHASNLLPKNSKIRVLHLGQAMDAHWRTQAEAAMRNCPRYLWLGAQTHAQTRRWIAQSHLLCLSSESEGGANVISEAICANTPVISSRISGTIGQLGSGYPGFFEVGKLEQLRDLLHRFEMESEFRLDLQSRCQQKAHQFQRARESESWQQLLLDVFASPLYN